MPVRIRRYHVLLWCGVSLALGASGVQASETVDLVVSSRQAWTDTSLDVTEGQRVRIEASGTARVLRMTPWEYVFGADFERWVGPQGTFLWPRDDPQRALRHRAVGFPLPAVHEGPHPAFCLIGKIGDDGPPFYVGRRRTITVERAGRLWLGLNDTAFHDNTGSFQVRLVVNAEPDPPTAPRAVVEPSLTGRPIPDARVLLLYVDGLRPDVVAELSALGFLPHLTQAFLEGGLECVRALTTFPSNTLVANGALFTGLFPDRTGIKSQNQFERTTLIPRGSFSEWTPQWLWVRTTPRTRVYDLLDKFAPENTHQFLRQRKIETLDSRLGAAYRFTILPITPMNPPPQWAHRALNTVDQPFAAAARIPSQLDQINARYLIEELLGDPEARVIAAWFPMVDKVSHHSPRGQFGTARREIVAFDRLLGQILRRLRQVGWASSTYVILISDHGHQGGEQSVNRHANLAHELFHRQLGCNVKVVGQEWIHPGTNPRQFVFLDHQAWGQASLFLPKGAYHHGPWQPNTLADLLRYDFGPNRGTVNLLETLVEFRGPEWEPGLARPVDLVLVRLDATRVLVYRSAENQAIIHTSVGPDGQEEYRYEVVRQVTPTVDGALHVEAAHAQTDPLGYLADTSVQAAIGSSQAVSTWLAEPHASREWLAVTAETDYPDAVVGFAKFFSWKPPVEDLEEVRTPDLVATAARGWSFRSDGEWGTDHGAPLRESMRISLWLAGPNIRRGIRLEPCRIVDLLPTILEMVGTPLTGEPLDGQALTGIYE